MRDDKDRTGVGESPPAPALPTTSSTRDEALRAAVQALVAEYDARFPTPQPMSRTELRDRLAALVRWPRSPQ